MDMEHNPERRQEKRQPQSGAIEISFADPVPVTVNGELIEVSGRGFRAADNTKGLTPGLEVEYRSSSGGQRGAEDLARHYQFDAAILLASGRAGIIGDRHGLSEALCAHAGRR